MSGGRIRGDKGCYIVEAGGRVYRLPKQYVEKRGDTVLVSNRTGYRFRSGLGRLAHHTPNQAEIKPKGAVVVPGWYQAGTTLRPSSTILVPSGTIVPAYYSSARPPLPHIYSNYC